MKVETRNACSIGIISLFAYSVFYITKNVLGALMTQMEATGPFDYEVLGNMGTVFLICYGVGQLVNGQLGNHISPRTMVTVGLAAPGLILILIPMLKVPVLALVLWGACGFFCSMLWGPLVRVVGENTEGRIGQVIISLMTAATVAGALIAYVLAIISSVTRPGSWRVVFFATGGVTMLSALVWFVGYTLLERRGVIRRCAWTRNKADAPAPAGPRMPLRRFLRYGFLLMICGMICSGTLRNAQALWGKTMMIGFLGFNETVGSSLSAMMPLFNLVGMFIAIFLLQRSFEKEKIILGGAFLCSVACFFAILLFHERAPLVSLIALLASCMMITVTDIMVASGYVMRFRETGALSGISGFFDACAYGGAGMANIFFTSLMSGGNWNRLLLMWVVIGGLGMLAGFVSSTDHKDAPHDDSLRGAKGKK